MSFLPIRQVTVSGDSMAPTFPNGRKLLFHGVGKIQALAGKVVLIERESYPGIYLIKRVVKVDGSAIWVEGDNKRGSTDSRQWGALTPQEIIAVAFRR